MPLSFVGECNLSRANVNYGSSQIESVKFVGTQVTDEESGAVRGNVAPGASPATLNLVKAFKSTRSSERVLPTWLR